MTTGPSTIRARAKVTPKAARFDAESGRRAITAATTGCSMAIMIHMAARGSQNQKMRRWVTVSEKGIEVSLT